MVASDSAIGRQNQTTKIRLHSFLPRVPILIVFAIEILAFLPALVQPGIFHPPPPKFNDASAIYYLWRGFWREEIFAGRLPLWNPYLFGGMPFLGEPQSAVFYPFNILFLLPVQLDFTFKLSMLLHLLISAFLMDRLCRSLGANAWGAAFAGFAFSFNAQFLNFLFDGWINVISVASWAPGVLWAFIEASRRFPGRGAAKHIVLGTVFLSFQFLGGHPEWAYYTLIALLTVAGYQVFQTGGTMSRNRRVAAALVPALAIMSLAALLSGPQVIPSGEAALNSARGQSALSGQGDTRGAGFPPLFLPSLVVPKLFGPWDFTISVDSWVHKLSGAKTSGGESLAYCGLLTLLFAGIGLKFSNRSIPPRVWLGIGIGALLIAINDLTHLKSFLDWLFPPQAVFRSPARFVFLTYLSLCVLASFGVTRLTERQWRPAGPFFRRLTFASLVLSASGIALVLLAPKIVSALLPAIAVPDSLRSNPVVTTMGLSQLGTLATAWAGVQLIQTSFLLALGVAAIWAISEKGLTPLAGFCCLVGVTALDLLAFGWPFLTSLQSPVLLYEQDLRRLAPIQESSNNGRIHFGDYQFFRSGPNVVMKARVRSTGGYDTFHLSNYVRFMEVAQRNDVNSYLGVFGVSHVVERAGLHGSFPRAQSGDGWIISRIARTLPRIYWTSKVIRVSDRETALRRLPELVRPQSPEVFLHDRNEFEIPNSSLLPRKSPSPSSSPPVGERRGEGGMRTFMPMGEPAAHEVLLAEVAVVRVTTERPGLLTATVQDSHEGWLVFNEMYYPGWKGRIDGVPTSIRQVNGIMQGILVPAGFHRVEFEYWPDSLRFGLLGTLLGVAGIIAMLLRDRFWVSSVSS